MSCRLGTPRSPLGKSAWPAAAPTPLPWSRLLAARLRRGTVVIVTSADLTAFHASSQARKSLYETNRPSRRVLILWIVVFIPPANALQNDPTTIEPSYRWEQGGFSRFTQETNIIFFFAFNSLLKKGQHCCPFESRT